MKKLSNLATEGRIFLVKMYYYHHMNMDYVKNAYKLSYEGVEVPSEDAILAAVSLFETTGSIHISQDFCKESTFEIVQVQDNDVSVDVKTEPEDEDSCKPEVVYLPEGSSGSADMPNSPLETLDEIKEENVKSSIKQRKVKKKPPVGEKSEETLFCSECDLSFKTKFWLKKHLQRAHIHKKFNCSRCNKKYVSQANFDSHQKACQGKTEEVFLCPVEGCGRTLKTKSTLKTHQRIHTSRDFICEVCGGRFLTQRLLTIHMVIHTGIKPFECDICFKKFTAKSTLKTHIRYHTGERPYKCDFCESAFVDRQTMIVHRRQHTGEQPFSCPYENCNRFFKQKQNLRSHLKHIHNVQPKPNAKKPSKY